MLDKSNASNTVSQTMNVLREIYCQLSLELFVIIIVIIAYPVIDEAIVENEQQ